MNIRTKVITTIIAMVCSLSVSATGIVAVMMSFETQVANSTMLEIGNIQGNLYGQRIGAGNEDLDLWLLFKNGEGEQEANKERYCRDVNFSNGSNKMIYILKFALAENADSKVMVRMDQEGLTNHSLFTADYRVAFGQLEPEDWSAEETISVGDRYIVDDENPYIWLYASLSINENTTTRINSNGGKWLFSFSFTGLTAVN